MASQSPLRRMSTPPLPASFLAIQIVQAAAKPNATVQELAKIRAITGFVQHHNGIFPWSVSASGEVKNAIA